MSGSSSVSILATILRQSMVIFLLLCILINISQGQTKTKLSSDPKNYLHRPFVECTTHTHCPKHQSCFADYKCRDPCLHTDYGVKCRPACRVVNHRPECVRKSPPPTELLRHPPYRCKQHSDCADHLTCFVDGDCKNACIHSDHKLKCGQNAGCKTVRHDITCSCYKGYVGNPFVKCYPIYTPEDLKPTTPEPPAPVRKCSRHEDCPNYLTCYYGENICKSSCNRVDGLQCGNNFYCIVVNHSPQCRSRSSG